jgi:hypothetical protein
MGYRIEEVHPYDPLRPARGGGDLGHGAGAALVEVGADLSPGAVEGLGGDVVEEGAVAAAGGRVGDAPAH